jgi:outer membrane lipoprotein-sorting protein
MRLAGNRIRMAALLLASLTGAGTARGDSEPEKWLNEAQAAYSSVTSYTAVFHKQQRVQGKLLPEETIQVKFKKPCSLYMKWIEEPYRGSELIYGYERLVLDARLTAADFDPNNPAYDFF